MLRKSQFEIVFSAMASIADIDRLRRNVATSGLMYKSVAICLLISGQSLAVHGADMRLRRALSPAFRAGLYPLIPWRVARGGRRIWRGEDRKYGFGGAVAGLGLLISGLRRRPRRSQL